jgi:hypothetical protein
LRPRLQLPLSLCHQPDFIPAVILPYITCFISAGLTGCSSAVNISSVPDQTNVSKLGWDFRGPYHPTADLVEFTKPGVSALWSWPARSAQHERPALQGLEILQPFPNSGCTCNSLGRTDCHARTSWTSWHAARPAMPRTRVCMWIVRGVHMEASRRSTLVGRDCASRVLHMSLPRYNALHDYASSCSSAVARSR